MLRVMVFMTSALGAFIITSLVKLEGSTMLPVKTLRNSLSWLSVGSLPNSNRYTPSSNRSQRSGAPAIRSRMS